MLCLFVVALKVSWLDPEIDSLKETYRVRAASFNDDAGWTMCAIASMLNAMTMAMMADVADVVDDVVVVLIMRS